MLDIIRRLTANYSEEEYKEWMQEPVVDDSAKKRNIELGMTRTPSFKFTENLIAESFYRMKDFDIALHEIAWETGYDYDFLSEVFNECDEDESYIDRIIEISDIAMEHDF